MWDLVPWPVIKSRTPALGAKSQSLEHQGSPQRHLFLFALFWTGNTFTWLRKQPDTERFTVKRLIPIPRYPMLVHTAFKPFQISHRWIKTYILIPTPSTEDWIKKLKEYYSATKRMKSCSCDRMDRTWGHCAKWNVRQREANTVWYHLYVGS